MTTTVLVGAQWGDEGKGKVSCYLAQDKAVVARYSGGSNAGHTVVVDGKNFKLHLIPAGIFYPDTLCVLGSGMVIDPLGLFEELQVLKEQGYPCKNLRISPLAHLVLPYHREIDALQERTRGKQAIGTTKKGIGPAYADKIERIGIRIGDLFDARTFREKLEFNLETKRVRFQNLNGALDSKTLFESYRAFGEKLQPMVTDTSKLILETIRHGGGVLCEGAQGTMLDIDFGTYPYVTSAATTAGGVASGLGIPPQSVDEVLGVAKAYITRVGEGVFPTEEKDTTGTFLRETGHEYGTTTGRARRCGWLDGVVLRYGNRLNGYSGLIITKLDVLTGLKEIKFCEAYRHENELLSEFPLDSSILSSVVPVYRSFTGWDEDITKVRKIGKLPKTCREYLSYIEEYCKVPIHFVSVGADRDEMILP